MISATPSDSSSEGIVPPTTLAAADSLQVPERSGTYSSDNLLAGTTTPSDVSSANSPAMLATTAAQPAAEAVEAFSLSASDAPAANASASARAGVVSASLLLPVEEDDDDDFIPRGGGSNPSQGVNKPPPKPTGVKR